MLSIALAYEDSNSYSPAKVTDTPTTTKLVYTDPAGFTTSNWIRTYIVTAKYSK